MKSLFIDTSSSNVTIKIIENDNIVASFYDFIKDDISSKILPIIESLFKEVNFKINEIEKIYVVNGPGSFTGIRIGVTIAKVLASQLNIEVCPISSLEYQASGTDDSSIVLIDARRGFVYAGAYDSNLNCLLNDQYISYESINFTLYNKVISYDDFNSIKPTPDTLKIITKYKNKGINAHKLKPNYLKLTEAEEKLKDKND